MSRFEPDSYRQYRVQYPESLFYPLRSILGPLGSRPVRVLDLGAGTGNSAWSFYRFYPGEIDFTLVDPDPKMLASVESLPFESRAQVSTLARESHQIPLSLESHQKYDVALVGSAWHWMKGPETLEALTRVLNPGAALFVFEYQFPKAVGPLPPLELNEWVRREFNLKWKEPDQKPRGSLRELTEPLRSHIEFSEMAKSECQERVSLGARDFHGVIVSQSRYLAYERGLSDEASRLFTRDALLESLKGFWQEEAGIPFEYGFEGRLFRKRYG